jgi:hypothetical protein
MTCPCSLPAIGGELVSTQIKMPTVTQQDRAAKDQFELVLRLQQSRNGHPTDGSAGLRLRTHALVKDILMSRLDIEAEVGAQEYVHAQGFADLGKALAASRALQLAFEGFRSAVPSGRANVSVVLDSFGPEEAQTAHASPSVEQKDLLDSAKPSQVLITQAFYKRIAHCQPLALRSFPPRAGVYEFLWTSEERLNELQAEAEFMPTLVSEAAHAAAPVNTVSDHPVAVAFEPRPRDFERPRVFERLSVLVHQALAKVQSRQRMLIISSAAAILIIVCYLVISHAFIGHRPKVAGRTLPTPDSRAVHPNPSPIATGPSILPSPGSPAPPPPHPLTPPSETTRPKIAPAAVPHAPNPTSPDGVLKPVPRVHDCSIAGLIPNYLSLAETNRNRGRYDAAIRQYNEVLGCEPNNREAQEGLRRTKDAERLNGIR